MASDCFPELFTRLADLLRSVAGSLVIREDSAVRLYIDTAYTMKNGKPLYFGSVNIGKRYVSFHLMPVYVEPKLLHSISPELRRRMQGKSCFNFTRPDEALIAELATLTRSAYDYYRQQGYI